VSILTIALVAAIVIYVIGSQIVGGALRGRRLIVLPVVLAVIAVSELSGRPGPHVTPAEIVLIAASTAIAAAIGVAQGASMRLESRAGALWGQMPVRTLWLWGLLIASRGIFFAIAHSSHEQLATSGGALMLGLAANRLGQALVVAARALAAGIPFASEKDGRSFLATSFGSAPAASSARHSRTTAFTDSTMASGRPGRAGGVATLTRHNVTPLLRQLSDRFDARR